MTTTQATEHIVLTRIGDFFEAFDEHAARLSEACGVTTSSYVDTRGRKHLCAGVPCHTVESYVAQLVKAGYRVTLDEPA